MKDRQTYKKLTAVLLLLVYLFIVTPVNLWHQHASPDVSANCFSSDVVKTSLQESLDGDCLICSHHYSSFPETEIFAFFSIHHPESITHVENYAIATLQILLHTFANKGPPTVV